MTVTLQKHHEELLQQEVASGRFATIEDALAFAVEHFLPSDIGDLSWARSEVDAARAEIGQGDHQTIDAYQAKLRARIRDLERQ